MAEIVNTYNELKEIGCSNLIALEKKNIFTYPDGYFTNLAADITRTIWLQSFSKKMLYTIPDGYFENFSQLILDKISVQFADAVHSKNTLYQLPDNYFDNLAGSILQKIKTQHVSEVEKELELISPLVSKISRLNVYDVPSGYFEKSITIQHKQEAKVISITSKSRKWFSYAAAACIAAIISLGGYFYIVNKPGGNTVQNQIAKINVDKAVSQLPDSALDSYLANDNSDMYSSQSSNAQDLDIQDLIKNTSDEDIENYLKQNPGADDNDNTKGI